MEGTTTPKQDTSCPHCGHSAQLLFGTRDYNRRLSDQSFDYYRCHSCGLIFLFPIPDDIDQYYRDDYYSLPSGVEALLPAMETERYKIEMVRQIVPRGRLLEIGPAVGLFAYLAKGAGFTTEVVEMDKACCEFIERVLVIPAINSSDIVDALRDRGAYDVIALWQVIEHLPDPWAVLPVLAQHLAPGGILVIAAPNPDAFQFRVLGCRWTHVDAPRHLELIPIPLLKAELAQHGLTPALITTTDEGSLGWNTFGWKFSLHNLVGEPRFRRLARAVGVVASRVFAPIERTGLRGSTYTLIFRRNT